MRTLAVAAGTCALLAALSKFAESMSSSEGASAVSNPATLKPSSCPPRTLPDGNVCVPVPRDKPKVNLERFSVSDHLPKNPDRPEALSRYQSPLKDTFVLRLDATSAALVLQAKPDQTLRLLALPKQTQAPKVLFLDREDEGRLAVLHSTEHGERPRLYVLELRGLRPASELKQGQALEPGTPIGRAFVSGSAKVTLMTYQVRQSVEPEQLEGESFARGALTMPTDPRNVLEIR